MQENDLNLLLLKIASNWFVAAGILELTINPLTNRKLKQKTKLSVGHFKMYHFAHFWNSHL